MKRFIAFLLLVLLAMPSAFAQEAAPSIQIPSVLTREIPLQGRQADGSFPDNPVVPGISSTTGLPTSNAKYLPVLSQIDNNLGALPQWGLDAADIMYELPVSGSGWTRLTALFADRLPAEAGPVRSARLMHADLREEWDALLLHYGEQTTAGSNFREAIRNYGVPAKGLEMDGIGNKYKALFPRTKYHAAPHNVSAHVSELAALVSAYEFRQRPFLFADGTAYAGPDAFRVSIIHKQNKSTASSFLYDVNRKVYLRFTAKGLYTDLLAPTAELTYANVIVQRTRLTFNNRSSNPLLPDVVGGGAADIFIGGKYIAGAWARATAQSRTVFFDQNGKELVLQPGRSWIVITDENTEVSYESAYDADTAAYYAAMGSLPRYKALNIGDSGDEVRALKQRLYEQGFTKSSQFNNRYQDTTVEMVKRFEESKGLPVDGIADSLMLAMLFEGAAPDMTTQSADAGTGDDSFKVDDTAEEPAVEEPAEEVAAEEPVAEESVAEQPAVEQPVAEEPQAEEPVAEEPVAEEPAAEEPAAEEPAAEEPVAEEPVAEEPAAEEPVAEEPAAEEPAAEEPVTVEPEIAVVRTANKGALNMRATAERNGKIVGRIPNGTQVDVLERGEEWTKVRHEDKEGYVMTSFLAEADPATDALYRSLTIGDKGPDVLKMKERFYKLGYFRGNSFNDVFQANTAETVKRFEKRNGLPVDGVADVEMLTLLFSKDAKRP